MSAAWEPASSVSREEVLKLHHEVATRPSFPTRIYEDVFRIQSLELDWDIGIVIYEPQDLTTKNAKIADEGTGYVNVARRRLRIVRARSPP